MANLILPKSKKLGDCTYTVEPLGGISGRKVFVRLLNMVGPAVGSLDPSEAIQDMLGKDKGGKAVNGLAGLMEGLGRLFATLRDEDLQFLQDQFAGRTTVTLPDGKAPKLSDVLDEHFTGERFVHYFLWLGWCLEATYGDFIGGAWKKASALAGVQLAKAQASSSDSLKASNGGSGG